MRREHLPRLVEIAVADPCHQTNPRPCTAAGFRAPVRAGAVNMIASAPVATAVGVGRPGRQTRAITRSRGLLAERDR